MTGHARAQRPDGGGQTGSRPVDPRLADSRPVDPRLADPRLADSRLADPRITAVGLLIETVGGLSARLATQYAEHDLSPAEFEVLVRLARTPGQRLRMSDLAAQTQLTTSGITRVVDRLERDRLVERVACPTDRRGSFAAVTKAGLARLDAVLPGHLDLVEKWFTSQLSRSELDALLRSLRTVRDAVRPEATAGAPPSDRGSV